MLINCSLKNIMSAKEEKNRVEKPLRFLKEVERPAPRPPTPQIEVPDLVKNKNFYLLTFFPLSKKII